MATEEPELVPAIHPGEFVWEDVLVPLSLDVPTAADKIGLPVGYLEALVEQRASVNQAAAEALGELAGNGPELWIGLQAAYDRWEEFQSQRLRSAPPIDLYGTGSPNVFKIYIALEELGLPYTVHPINVFRGDQFTPEFLRLNPMAKVPVITDRDGPGGKPCTLFESGAILLYLAEKTGNLLPRPMAARFAAIQWMMVQMTTLGPMFGQYIHFSRFAPPGNDYARGRYATQVHRVLEVMDHRLAVTPWLGGAEYGIADIAAYPWARDLPALLGEAAGEKYRNIVRWADAMADRPAVMRALIGVNDARTRTALPGDAQPQMLDRIFGRGQYSAAE